MSRKRTRTQNRRLPFLRSLALAVIVVAAITAIGTASASTSPGRVTKIQASCAGDVINGKAKFNRPALVSLQLLTRRAAGATFATARKKPLRARRAGFYRFKFDISKLDAYSYRVRAGSAQSRILRSTTCAPGYQVPEAPLAILLPLSLLLAVGLPLAIRSRRRRFAADRT